MSRFMPTPAHASFGNIGAYSWPIVGSMAWPAARTFSAMLMGTCALLAVANTTKPQAATMSPVFIRSSLCPDLSRVLTARRWLLLLKLRRHILVILHLKRHLREIHDVVTLV